MPWNSNFSTYFCASQKNPVEPQASCRAQINCFRNHLPQYFDRQNCHGLSVIGPLGERSPPFRNHRKIGPFGRGPTSPRSLLKGRWIPITIWCPGIKALNSSIRGPDLSFNPRSGNEEMWAAAKIFQDQMHRLDIATLCCLQNLRILSTFEWIGSLIVLALWISKRPP